MLFKRQTLLVFLLVLPTVFGCSNNYDFEDEELDIRLNFDTNCIDELEQFFSDYMKEKSSKSSIVSNVECMLEAVDYVKFRVSGEVQERYTLAEIKSFFNQFVFKESPKKTVYFESALKIKREILGGSAQFLTFAELKTIQDVLIKLEPVLIRLASLTQEMIGAEPFKNKDEIKQVVFYGFGFLNDLFSYDIRSFSTKKIIELSDDFINFGSDTESWIQIFNLLRGKERSEFVIESEDKFLSIETLGRYYQAFFNLKFEIEGNWENSIAAFEGIKIEAYDLLGLLKWSLTKKQDKRWSKEDLVHIFELLSASFLDEIGTSTIEGLIDVVFSKWFANNDDKTSFDLDTLDIVSSDIDSLVDFLEQSQPIEGYIGKTFPNVSTSSVLFNEFLSLKWPSIITDERSFFVDVQPFDSKFSFKALFQWSWAFVFSEVFSRTYAKDPRGLSIDQVRIAYLDVFSLLVDLDVLTEASRSSWFRIFNEGDLLVPSADPNGYVSRKEMSEYFSYMFSAYFSGNEAYERAIKFCTGLSKDCVFEKMREPGADFFRTMPSLNTYLNSTKSSKNFSLWADSFEYIAKLDINEEAYTSNMFFRASVGNQYVEVLFRKYDLDRSGTFNFDETERAFEDFKFALRLLPQVQGTIAESSDRILKAFFTYFVDNGELPKLVNGYPSGSFIKYMLLCGVFNANSCAFESDRSSILAILAYLTSVELVEE